MQSSDLPAFILIPFAQSGDKNPIPDSGTGHPSNWANKAQGFPPADMSPGGQAPDGPQFNELFYLGDIRAQAAQIKGGYPWNSAFSSAIGGYPKGAVVQKTPGPGRWECVTENNTTNPDAGGSGWRDMDLTAPKVAEEIIYSASGTISGAYVAPAGVQPTSVIEVEIQAAGGGSLSDFDSGGNGAFLRLAISGFSAGDSVFSYSIGGGGGNIVGYPDGGNAVVTIGSSVFTVGGGKGYPTTGLPTNQGAVTLPGTIPAGVVVREAWNALGKLGGPGLGGRSPDGSAMGVGGGGWMSVRVIV